VRNRRVRRLASPAHESVLSVETLRLKSKLEKKMDEERSRSNRENVYF
jgi:hypothetical protein